MEQNPLYIANFDDPFSIFPRFKESDISLPSSQETVTSPYSEPHKISPQPSTI